MWTCLPSLGLRKQLRRRERHVHVLRDCFITDHGPYSARTCVALDRVMKQSLVKRALETGHYVQGADEPRPGPRSHRPECRWKHLGACQPVRWEGRVLRVFETREKRMMCK